MKLEAPAESRRRLPDERAGIVHKFSIAGHEGYVHVGLYADGTPGEVFVKMSKMGSTVSGLMDGIALLTSLCLQHGVPLETLCSKFRGTRFEPLGITENPAVREATSVLDYIFRWLALKFLDARPDDGDPFSSGMPLAERDRDPLLEDELELVKGDDTNDRDEETRSKEEGPSRRR